MPRGHVVPNGALIAALRGEAGLTQDELAARAGYGLRTIGKIETGHRTTALTLSAIATVLERKLGRHISLANLLGGVRNPLDENLPAADGLLVSENVRLLELRGPTENASSGQAGSHAGNALLTDTHCLRQLPRDLRALDFYYPTEGTAVRGVSLSHPQRAEWISPGGTGSRRPAATPVEDCHVLRLTVPRANLHDRAVVQNCVEYVDGFGPARQQWLTAHVAYPTECLTLMVRFPEGRRYRSLRAAVQSSEQQSGVPSAEKPISIAERRMAYWRIEMPKLGATYQLGWT